MTAPEPTWTVADHAGMPTLLRDGQPVAYLDDAMLHVSPLFAEQGFAVLTRVLAPDEATLMELDQRIDSYARVLDDPEQVRFCTEDVLSHLSGSGESA